MEKRSSLEPPEMSSLKFCLYVYMGIHKVIKTDFWDIPQAFFTFTILMHSDLLTARARWQLVGQGSPGRSHLPLHTSGKCVY